MRSSIFDFLKYRCTQGLVNDRQWHCGSVEASHKVCGHVGTLAFNSPEYQVAEQAGFLLVTVFRTGGGVGETSVDYAIRYSSNPGKYFKAKESGAIA